MHKRCLIFPGEPPHYFLSSGRMVWVHERTFRPVHHAESPHHGLCLADSHAGRLDCDIGVETFVVVLMAYRIPFGIIQHPIRTSVGQGHGDIPADSRIATKLSMCVMPVRNSFGHVTVSASVWACVFAAGVVGDEYGHCASTMHIKPSRLM